MPKYVARLEAQDDSGHYRHSVIWADSKEEAKQTLLEREETFALYRLDTTELADLEGKEAALPEGARLAGRERSQLALHRQEKPYKLVSLTEAKD